MDPYLALKKEADLLGLPKHFKTDLTEHDKRCIRHEECPDVFGWVIYECGTHFIDPYANGKENGLPVPMISVFREVLKTCFGENRHCYVWDGRALLKMKDADHMLDYLEEARDENF